MRTSTLNSNFYPIGDSSTLEFDNSNNGSLLSRIHSTFPSTTQQFPPYHNTNSLLQPQQFYENSQRFYSSTPPATNLSYGSVGGGRGGASPKVFFLSIIVFYLFLLNLKNKLNF